MKKTKQNPLYILSEIGEERKNELLYSILEEFKDWHSKNEFNTYNIARLLCDEVNSINSVINENSIICMLKVPNVKKYAKKITDRIIITDYLINSMEKELEKESDVDMIYSNDYIHKESFSKYFGVERNALDRLKELLQTHRKEILDNIEIQDVDFEDEDIIKDRIKKDKTIFMYIYKTVYEALDFDFFIKDEENYIKSIKKDGPEGDEDFYNWSINYHKDILIYLRQIKRVKKCIVSMIVQDITSMKFSQRLYNLYDNEAMNKKLYEFINNKVQTEKKVPTLKKIMDYYDEIYPILSKDSGILPEYDITEYLVKRLLNSDYIIKFDYTDEFKDIPDIDESYDEEPIPGYLKPHIKTLKPRKYK